MIKGLMNRRILKILQKSDGSQTLSTQQSIILSQYLEDHFFKSLKEPINYADLLPYCKPFEFTKKQVIFSQGQPVTKFYFILSGWVGLINRKSQEYKQMSMKYMQNQILGEFFYNNHHSVRSWTAMSLPDVGHERVYGFYIEHDHLMRVCQEHVKQYAQIGKILRKFTSEDGEDSEWHRELQSNQMYRGIFYRKCKYGQNIAYQNAIGIIIEGECLMKQDSYKQSNPQHILTNHKKISLCQMDGVYLEEHFKRSSLQLGKNVLSSSNTYQYKVMTEHIVMLCIPIVLLYKLPSQFINKLKFIQKCHRMHFSSVASVDTITPFHSSDNASKKFSRVKRQIGIILPSYASNENYCHNNERMPKIFRQSRATHKPQKIQAIFFNLQEVKSIEKDYCLGYSLQIKQEPSISRIKKIIKEPKGYFQKIQLKNIRNYEESIKHRDWSEYLSINKDSTKLMSKLNYLQSLTPKNHIIFPMTKVFGKIFANKKSQQKSSSIQSTSEIKVKNLLFPKIL